MSRVTDQQPTSLAYGPLHMDLTRHEVTAKNQEVPPAAKEFGLLEHLLRHPGRVLTREVLLNEVWGYNYYGTTRTVDVHVRRLKVQIPVSTTPSFLSSHSATNSWISLQPNKVPPSFQMTSTTPTSLPFIPLFPVLCSFNFQHRY